MDSLPILNYVLIGQLKRDYILPPSEKPILDVIGGNLVYTAVGLRLWQSGAGLVARIGEDYPHSWLEKLVDFGFDRRGIKVLPENFDLRFFTAYTDPVTRTHDSPISHFARLGIPFPKSLLGYSYSQPGLDSRTRPTDLSIRPNDIPADYLDATAAHICALDFFSHTILPSALHRGNISTITLEPSAGYMNPTFWNDIPLVVRGLTAFIVGEEKVRNLFQGRSDDIWEMAEALADYGCEMIVVKMGARGQYVFVHDNRTRWMIPAYPARITNPSGAGDAFCGGFLAGYRTTYDPLAAALHGSISASMVVEGDFPFYALDSMPGLASMRLESLRDRILKA